MIRRCPSKQHHGRTRSYCTTSASCSRISVEHLVQVQRRRDQRAGPHQGRYLSAPASRAACAGSSSCCHLDLQPSVQRERIELLKRMTSQRRAESRLAPFEGPHRRPTSHWHSRRIIGTTASSRQSGPRSPRKCRSPVRPACWQISLGITVQTVVRAGAEQCRPARPGTLCAAVCNSVTGCSR